MLTLIIETSTPRGILCLFRNDSLVYREEFPFGLNHSKLLISKMQEGLHAIKMAPSNIRQIGVGVGPGSYTGIRVGAAVAKTLAYSLHIPLVGISTLSCFIPTQDGPFAAIIDAKIGGIYLQTGEKKQGKVEYLSPPQVCSLAEAGELLKGVWNIVTPECRSIQPKLESLYVENEWTWEELSPNPSQILTLINSQVQKGKFTTDGSLELLYLRKTQAELEREIN